jgi:hypothetical protein
MSMFDFLANAAPDDPRSYQALEMRKKIALAAIVRDRKGYPKNIGEGLTAIGDALGERAQVNQALASQSAYEDYTRKNPPPSVESLTDAQPSNGPRADASPDVSIRPPVVAADDDTPAVANASPVLPAPSMDTAQSVMAAPPAAYFPAPSTAQASAPPPSLAPTGGPMNPVQASQMAQLTGPPPTAAASSFAPTAALNNPAVQSDAAPPPGASLNPAVRNSIAQILAARGTLPAQGVPQPNPTLGAGIVPPAAMSPALALTAGSPDGAAGNRRIDFPMPNTQVAQAGPPPIPYTPPVKMPPSGPVPDQPANALKNGAEIKGEQMKQMGIQLGDPNMKEQGQFLIDKGKELRDKADADAKAAWEAKIQTERARQIQRQEAEQSQSLRQQQLDKATAEANVAKAGDIITKNTGLPAQAVMEDFKARQSGADRDVSLIRNARIAKQMLETGVVSGLGANLQLDLARAKALWGNIPADELATRSQRALAATKAMVGYGLNQLQPGDTRVTNGDQIVATGIIGGDPSQQLQSRKDLVNTVIQDSNRRVGEYERRHGIAFEGTPAGEMYRLRTDPIHDDPKVAQGALQILLANPGDDHNRQMFDKHFGPGSAELEIVRAERRAKQGK